MDTITQIGGFKIVADNEHLSFIFSKEHVATNKLDKSGAYPTYGDWLNSLDSRTIHYSEILPVQYNLNDLATKIKNKLDNTVFVLCKTETNKETGHKRFFYDEAFIFSGFRTEQLIELFNTGGLFLDFDARTTHNHGTKVRVKRDRLKDLFQTSIVIE